jgi:hypothetical protein
MSNAPKIGFEIIMIIYKIKNFLNMQCIIKKHKTYVLFVNLIHNGK